ncbi:hypothetical protein [Paenibacillus caui]|uniref:hypothetical protein n=1 Tax=Paenibacillus caui TaxID=2873927 RepID=UPI001CA8533E|nr:hypothetical protein [Paenibacillus caui]
MKPGRLFLGILLLLLAGGVYFGIQTKASFISNVQLDSYMNHDNVLLSLIDSERVSSIYFYNEIKTAGELEKQSALIVKAKVTEDRKNYSHAVRSGVQVLEVYKGNGSLKGSKIYIFEPSNFLDTNYFSFGGYQLMQTGKEYILFINPLKKPKHYSYKNDEAISYMPVSSHYGKFPLQEAPGSGKLRVLTQEELDQGVPYSQIKDWDILTMKEGILKTYMKIKQDVLSTLVNS